jgi:hypothetical protein
VLQTDHYWASIDMKHWDLCFIPHKVGFKEYAAPSMAEVWRELPEGCKLKKYHYNHAAFDPSEEYSFDAANPTDALIDLLIWLRKEANHE